MRGCRPLVACFPGVLLLACCRTGTASGKEEIVTLGGVRNVTATVSEQDGAYRIAVEMLPVRAFDPTTNRALNLSKGRMYAAQALGRHLKAGSLTIRGLEIQESDTGGGHFRLVAVVPRDGVSAGAIAPDPRERHKTAVAATRLPDEEEPRRHEIRLTADATTADFLNRKADYSDTVAQLQEALSAEGDTLERQSAKPEGFYDSIASVEERAEAAFKAILRQVNEDKLLLSIEQEELRPALEKARAKVLESLKSAVARFDQRQERTKKEEKK